MSRSICLFGELDTYAGSFPQAIDALPELVKQLKVACLLYDEVIVNTNVLLDHALTLPAFNVLSPFTKSGVLWTSSVEGQGQPEDYIVERAQKLYGENLNEGISKKSTEKLLHIIENWQSISPNEWKLVRKVSHQQENATTNIIQNLQGLPFLSKQANETKKRLVDLVSYMQDQSVFDRNEIIARLGGEREQISTEEFSQLALIVQGEYMNQGAHNKGNVNISLFPGKYIQQLKQNDFLFQAQALPADLNTLEKVSYRLSGSDFPLSQIASISSSPLYYLSQSSDWKIWRNYLLSDDFSYEAIKEMKALHKIHDRLENILSILLRNIDTPSHTDSTPLIIPSPWYSSGLALMGFSTQAERETKPDTVFLSLNSRQIHYQNSKLILEKPYLTLLSLLASTGNTGVPIETIKQLDIEIDLVKRTFQNTWRPQKNDREDLDIARLNRLNVAKNRINKKLKEVKLAIHVDVGEGMWSLVSLKNKQAVHINLEGSPWENIENNQTVYFPPSPANLSKTQLLIWDYFIKRHSTFITAEAIAIEIDSPNKTTKQISDIMYKFKQKIKNSPFQLIRSYQGEYMLLSTCDE